MSTSPAHLPLELLFPRLEAAGFALNTARRLRVWRVLHGEGARFAGDMEGLKFLLCPLLARTPQEQQRFYVIFEQFWAECVKEWEEWPEGEEETTLSEANSGRDLNPVVGSGPKKLKYLVWAFTAIAIITGIFFINKNYFKEAVKSPLARFALSNEYEQGIISGDSLEIGNFSEHYDSTKVHWEIKDQATGEVLHHDSSTATSWVVPEAGKKVSIALSVLAKPGSHLPKDTSLWPDSLFATSKEEYIIHCSDIPEVGEIVSDASNFIVGKPYKFEIKAEKGCYIEWVFSGAYVTNGEYPRGLIKGEYPDNSLTREAPPKLDGTEAIKSFDQEGNYQIRARVFRGGKRDYCYREVSKSFTVGSSKPFLRLAELKYDHPRQILQVSWLGWLLVFLPLLPALWFFYRWWKKRNETPKEKTDAELAAEYPFVDAAPYYIPYLPQEEKISVPREFFRIAEILRRREDAERREFSAQDSVKATIAAGGFPTWRDRAKTRPSDYLFLIKRPDERDQQFRLFERLADFMTRRDAPITTYFHDGRFERFWTAGEEKSIDLQQLNRQFPQHRLIILGDGHDLVNPTSKASPSLLRNPAQSFLRWPRRLLLTPEAVSGWSYQEGLLHQIFPIFPADTDGILQGLDMLDRIEEHQPGLFEKWQEEQQHRRPDATHRYRNASDLSSLRQILAHDTDLWRWCQALAVCAQPDWSLTIAVGRAIGIDVTHDRLLALTRVDWLRRNESDDHLRLELLKTLDPVDEKAARSAVASELEQVEEQVKNGFAATEWAANLAVQRFALDPRDKAHKQSIRHLQRLGLLSGGQVAELEWIIEKDELVSPGGEKLKRYLELPEDKPFLTWELGTAIILCISSMLLFWNARSFDLQQRPAPANLNAVPFWQVAKILDDRAIELNNQAAGIGQYIATEKSYTRWQGYAEDSKEANTLWEQAIALRQPDGYALADSNRYAHRFNAAAQLLNFYLKDSIKSNEFRTDSIALSAAAGSFMELVNGSYWNTNDPRRIEAQHAMGLCHFYLKDTAVARRAYQLIIGSNPIYFDTLSMPVNLQTLLADIGKIKTQYALRILVLDDNTGKSIPNVVLKPKNLPSLRSDATGRATYTFPSQPASGKINATIQKAGYESWSGTLQPRTSTQTDTIRLFLPKPVAPSDRDGDGVFDSDDECPEVKGTAENKGCPPPVPSDADGDGIADKDDACPEKGGPVLTKGCPDTDNDGVPDINDKCPNEKGDPTYDGCIIQKILNDTVNNQTDPLPILSNSLFPLYGVILGKTTVREMSQFGVLDSAGYACYIIQNTNFWFHQTDIANYMYLTYSDKMPEKWQSIGFNWDLSYNEWINLFQKLGYKVKVTQSPTVTVFSGHDSFSAKVEAYFISNDVQYEIALVFNYSEGVSPSDKQTLYSIGVNCEPAK